MTRTRPARRAAVLGSALLAVAACRTREPQGTDTRTAIPLPVEARDAVLAEMRTMLGSLNGILAAATGADTAAIRRAALASGTAGAADPTLERLLPEPFLQMGMSTHAQFDSIASGAAGPAAADSAVARLARLTGNCVSCHAQYRLTLK